ncbi:MAG: methyl-accepting chemotaxis protein [Pseudomonadota bacterium]
MKSVSLETTNATQQDVAIIKAISRVQAIIEFDLNGHILTANQNFLQAMGYTLDEIKGKHHQIFVDSVYANSLEYQAFWQKLRNGQFETGEYKRLGKGNKEVWIRASYNPIYDEQGKPEKIIKFATDVTQEKLQYSDFQGQIDAISKSQAVIEFNMDGTIIVANDNFCNAMGYSLHEIQGRHHSLFVETQEKSSLEYQQFWDSLNRGEFKTGEFKRFGKHRKEVWIQASYNPILDLNGKPFKVVKYATDITANKTAVKTISDSLLALSEGEIHETLDQPMLGEFEILRSAMNSTLERLYNMIKDINMSATVVNSGAQEIQTGVLDLSQRTDEQASSLEETASGMEQLTATVSQNAKNAENASRVSAETTTSAEKGGEVVGKAIAAMKEIESASKKIADIISVIDEIAFQTNLLALNAAVEAARAGEQGRGFAVVAGEVRNLAQRSAAAAKEIKSLINESVDKVEDGTRLVNQSGETLEDIVESIRKVNREIASISQASQEQASGINEVNTAISQMEEMTQQNAALVEESSASTEQLAEQAEKLLELTQFFKIHATQ